MKEISQKDFEKLCGLQCTKKEVCCFFDVTDKTLERWCKRTYRMGFSEVFEQKRGAGKISLRRSQFDLATKNANMAIWLGKQYLGQRDAPEDGRNEGALVDRFLQAIRPTREAVEQLYAEENE